MKYLLIITLFFTAEGLFAQQRFDIELWKKKQGHKEIPENLRNYKRVLDSLRLTYKMDNMPNAFTRSLPKPKLVGNNGKGHNIYILPVDNMPIIKPDSTYLYNMPVSGFSVIKSAH